ncbi:MAG TPA: PTS sugar transporter subunit IIA [Longimicrobiales bacterium]|nr:PTS sugar transporter subunit IIA [Longimicrobiales bacterium]
MRLREFLRGDFVILDLDARDVEGVVGELSAGAGRAGIGPVELIEEKLLDRERVHPTVMGSGLAIPHATVPGLEGPVIGVALAGGEPVAFGGPDQEPVRVFFVLLSPPGREREHVKLLARICRLVRHEGFIEELERQETGRAVVEVIQRIDDQHV